MLKVIISKNKHFIPLLLLILTLFFFFSTVSAADTIYVNTTGNDTSGTGAADHPYLTIQKGVDNLDPNGTIHIAGGEYSGINNTKLTLDKNMSLIGQTGSTINGKHMNWIFKIQKDVYVTISNITIANGYTAKSGGAVQNHGELTLTNMIIVDCSAIENGGGVYSTGNCTIRDCNITRNNQTGTNNTFAGGGIINDGGNCTIIRSEITYNSANANAGGIATQFGNCSLADCKILNNKANHGAGIVNYGGNCTITRSDILNNSANIIAGIGNQFGNCNITSCNIQFNQANDGAGIANANGNCTISNSDIINNSASEDGGAILNYFESNGSVFDAHILNLEYCTFNGNTAGRDGGAISNQCTINVDNSGFDACVLNLNHCTFNGNNAGRNGGAISNQCMINVTRVNASSLEFGACVLNMNHCNFKDNIADGDGGAISNNCTVKVTGNSFLNLGACVLNVNDCALSWNTAIRDGGAISNHCKVNSSGLSFGACVLNVDRSTLTHNSAGGDGGAIWNEGKGNLHFNRIVFNNAHALYSTNSIDATYNWWGSNDNPKNNPNNFGGLMNLINADPWLILTIKSSPTSIDFGETSTVTASVIMGSNGVDTSQWSHIPDGTSITITTDLGNLGSKSITLGTFSGVATAILRANDGWGTAHLYAILDGFMTPQPAIVVIAAPATLTMQKTGIPITGLLLAVLMILVGLNSSKRK